MSKYDGNDNYGVPRANYLTKIAEMDDKSLRSECYSMIYQSARCANQPKADWHWRVDACYDECGKRGNPDIYKKAYDECVKDHAG